MEKEIEKAKNKIELHEIFAKFGKRQSSGHVRRGMLKRMFLAANGNDAVGENNYNKYRRINRSED